MIKKKKVFYFGVAGFLLFIFAYFWFWPDDKLHLIACDVGQGDALMITYRFSQVLIDGGANNQVLSCLAKNLPFWDRKIEVVVNTHPEKDHLLGLIEVVKRYEVDRLLINSFYHDSAVFEKFHQEVLKKKIPILSPKKGEKIKIDSLTLEVLWPEEKLGDERIWLAERLDSQILGAATFTGKVNETSIVLKLSFGEFNALLPGDIGEGTEKKLTEKEKESLKGIEVLKVAHHGSKYSSSDDFLQAVKPALAIISVGKNSWGHPTEEVMERLRYQDIKMLRTDKDGEIKIITDGEKWEIKS